MSVSIEQIKQLREQTGLSIMQCKDALEAVDGDMDKAIEELRKKGAAVAAKKTDRELGAGTIASYVHAGNTIGAMVELLCETDFVARNEEFQQLAYEIAMQVAATDEHVLEEGAEELLKQPYIKETDRTVGDLLQDATQKFGERIELGRINKLTI